MLQQFLEISRNLIEQLLLLGKLLLQFVLTWSLLIAWLAWWLLGVNWHKVWPVLTRGAWVPVVFLTLAAALAWSQIESGPCTCLGLVTVPGFWWQLGGMCLVLGLTLFCGWLQGALGWRPTEINLEPPAASHEVTHH